MFFRVLSILGYLFFPASRLSPSFSFPSFDVGFLFVVCFLSSSLRVFFPSVLS